MISISHITKGFGKIKALSDLTMEIEDGQVFGMIGTNGAGKSTLLRIMSGVLLPDEGEVLIDGGRVYDVPETKVNIFFIPDEVYFFSNSSAQDMRDYYAGIYPKYDKERFDKLLENLNLDKKIKISTYSKGMKKQLSLVLAICAGTKYIYCDETFDGLDPVMRQAAKSLLAHDMEERGMTPILTSHNLRELEDICDHVGLIHKGGVLLSRDIEDMKLNLQKVQCVFKNEEDEKAVKDKLDILIEEKRGRLMTITARGTKEEIDKAFSGTDMVFYETLNLSLEEIFISETEVAGYDIKKLIMD